MPRAIQPVLRAAHHPTQTNIVLTAATHTWHTAWVNSRLLRNANSSLRLFHILAGELHYVGGGRIDLLDQCIGLGTGHRTYLQVPPLSVSKEFRVLHGQVEGVAQHHKALCRNVGRRRLWACHGLAGDDQLQNGVLIRVLSDVQD